MNYAKVADNDPFVLKFKLLEISLALTKKSIDNQVENLVVDFLMRMVCTLSDRETINLSVLKLISLLFVDIG